MKLPPKRVSQNESKLQHENEELVNKNESLNAQYLEVLSNNKAKEQKINSIEDKIIKVEASAHKIIQDKSNEVFLRKH